MPPGLHPVRLFLMKLCDATQFYSEAGGGVRRYLMEKRRYVEQHTEDEHVLLVPGAETRVVREGRLTLCTVASPRLTPTSRYRVMLNLNQAMEFLRREKPDLIESGDPYHLGWRMVEAGRELNVPVVGFYHSHFPEAYLRTTLKFCGSWVRDAVLAYAQDYINRLYNEFDATLVPSRALVELLQQWGVENAALVRLGVDAEIFCPGESDAALRKAWGAHAGQRVLLYVGRLAGEKNTPLLLECFGELHRRHPDRYVFVIVGDGALRDEVKSWQRRLPCLRWTDHCGDSAELARYYRSADLFVHPGVCETFGLVTLESQACGCPVVGIRGTRMDALIKGGLEDWAAANTPQALADAVERMLQRDMRRSGQEISHQVRQEYAWPEVLRDLWKIYHTVITRYRQELRYGAQ